MVASLTRALAVVVLVVLAGCGGSGSRVGLTDRAGWVAAEHERLGYAPDAAQLAKIEHAHVGVCHLDHAAFADYVASALDQDRADVVDTPVRWFCPGRANELRKILTGLPGGSSSAYAP